MTPSAGTMQPASPVPPATLPAAAGHAVVVEDPEHANLLALLLQGYLAQKVRHPRLARKARRLRGSYGVQVGTMAVSITFSPQGVSIRSGAEGRTRARVRGPMEEMIPLVLHGHLLAAVIAVLEGRIAIRGNPFALLGLLPLLLGNPSPRPLPPPTQEAQ